MKHQELYWNAIMWPSNYLQLKIKLHKWSMPCERSRIMPRCLLWARCLSAFSLECFKLGRKRRKHSAYKRSNYLKTGTCNRQRSLFPSRLSEEKLYGLWCHAHIPWNAGRVRLTFYKDIGTNITCAFAHTCCLYSYPIHRRSEKNIKRAHQRSQCTNIGAIGGTKIPQAMSRVLVVLIVSRTVI